ncbi:uncharacterized protein LOC118431717 [Branchiostoma floridae]|uniref:Uncharacterized protein LOC118431717 n=1 Tax=Branchiostoma floridae TaxID=7739 RepID=A0A9J7MCS5_BRAFL|nr:uncharacterized protein LOC118431717 [Branchiostoma floridae]
MFTEDVKPQTTPGAFTKPSATFKSTVQQTQSSFVTAERPPTFFFEVTMVNIEFTEELNNPTSEEFTSLASQLTETIWLYLQESYLAEDIVSVVITRFRKGSVIADYEVNLRQDTVDVTDLQVRDVFLLALSNITSKNNSLGIQVDSLYVHFNYPTFPIGKYKGCLA